MSYKSVWSVAGIALASVVGVGVSAQAADLGERRHGGYKDEPAYEAPAHWSGPYVGGHLGAAWTNSDADVTWRSTATVAAIAPTTVNYDLADTALLGGVHLGYNWQRRAFVAGVEGDISFADRIDYLASVRGRLGVAAGAWLFYGAGGVAFAGINDSGTITDGSKTAAYSVGGSEVGYVVGGGAEVKVSHNWSVGVEGLYYGFDGLSERATGSYAGGVYTADANAGADFAVVRGRVSYHFGHGYEPLK